MSLRLVDTHAHLHWPSLATDIDGVLSRACAAGVVRILTLGTEPRSCRAALAVAEKHQEVYAAVGLHPGDIPPDPEPAFDEIGSLLSHPRVVAIGETGLDYFHPGNPPRQAQIDAFTRHLELAARTGKPVCVHNREATDDVMRLLDRHARLPPRLRRPRRRPPRQARQPRMAARERLGPQRRLLPGGHARRPAAHLPVHHQ